MSQVTLTVDRREVGKKYARALRREEKVPGVYYVDGESGIPIVANRLALRPIVFTADTHVVDMAINGEAERRSCILKDVDFDPVSGNIVHFDLLGLVEGQAVEIPIPLKFTGQAVGEIAGGVANAVLNKVRVKCLPKDIPDNIEVDVSELKIGDNLRIKNITWDQGKILDNEAVVIYNVSASRRDRTATEEGEDAEEVAAEGAEASTPA